MDKLWVLFERWHEKSSGWLISLLVFGIFLIPQVKNGWADLGWMNLVIDIAVSFTVYAIWWCSTRVKKHPKNVVGIDLVLVCDTREQEKRVRADFVETLKEVLSNGEVPFSFIMHSKSKAGDIGDLKGASRFMDISGGRFLIKAKAKLRKIDDEERNVVEMVCTVSHSKVQSRVKEFLAEEIDNSMRKDDIISHNNDIYQFRNAAERVDVSTRYILALASLVSGDYGFSRSLCIDLKNHTVTNSR